MAVDSELAAFEAAAAVVHVGQKTAFRRPWAIAVDRAIGRTVEPLAALIVAAEIIILASSVLFRYVLRNPLVWGDALATILLLWLAMLGAVVAYRRGEHIRMTALVRKVSPEVAEVLEAIS